MSESSPVDEIRLARQEITPTDYLTCLFGGETLAHDARILVWRQSDKISTFFPNAILAGKAAERDALRSNMYVGCAVGPANTGETSRFSNETALGIPGFWLDFDYVNVGHKKTNLPENDAVAWQFISQFPIEPTIAIHSGGGYQLWWLFHELWYFETQAEHEHAQRLVKSWQGAFKSLAKSRGWDVDSTFDLARVLRIAGTFNHKHNPALPIHVQSRSEKRYSYLELAQHLGYNWLADYEVKPKGVVLTIDGEVIERGHDEGSPDIVIERSSFRIDRAATPPADKLLALFEFNEKASASWYHQCKEWQDQSLSAYDMSLANCAMDAGWGDQEIVDLLIAHRRKYAGNEEERKLRADYYHRTLTNARDWVRQLEAKRQTERIIKDSSEVDDLGKTEISREDLLKAISTKIGVEITRIVKFTSDPCVYRIYSGDRELELGDSGALLDQNAFRRRILDLAGVVVQRMKGELWDTIVGAMSKAMEEMDPGDEASPVSQMRVWIRDYISARPPVIAGQSEDGQWQLAAIGHNPFVRNHKLYISTTGSTGLGMQIYVQSNTRLQGKKISVLMRANGWVYGDVSLYYDGRTITRGLWSKKYNPEEYTAVVDKDNDFFEEGS